MGPTKGSRTTRKGYKVGGLCSACQQEKGEYICQPCNLPCDTLVFSEGGTCPHCGMKLLKRSEIVNEADLAINAIDIKTGSGVFLVEGGIGNKERLIKVYYHRPKNFSKKSNILLVVPGAGRNGDSYRDAWVAASEQNNVLILALTYATDSYPFEKYHLGGLIKHTNLSEVVEFVENTNIAKLDEQSFRYAVNENNEEWIFDDFDRIFDFDNRL